MKTVIMTGDALDNYGAHWAGVRLEVTSTANKYMPAAEFFARGKPDGYHPGYDESAGCALYDLRVQKTGEELPFSLYAWEVRAV